MARFAHLLGVLGIACFVSEVASKRVFSHLILNPGAVKVGCMPADFSGSEQESYSFQFVEVGDLCEEWSSSNINVTGRTVVIKRGRCPFSVKAANAIKAGAAGAVVTNVNKGEFPFPMSWRYTNLKPSVQDGSRNPIEIPMCLVNSTVGEALSEFSEIRWDGFRRYDHISETIPVNREAKISIVSPFELKWDFPAAQASFNPDSMDALSAEVKQAAWADECVHTRDELRSGVNVPYLCRECWELEGGPLKASFHETNEDDTSSNRLVRPKVAFFYGYSLCYRYYHEIAKIAQDAGAKGAIITIGHDYLPPLIAPYVIPYELEIPTYGIRVSTGYHWQSVLSGRGGSAKRVFVELPSITRGIAEAYLPHIEENEALTEVILPVSGCELATSVRAGQATFNPDEHPQISGKKMKRMRIAPSCGAVSGDDGDLHGRDCIACAHLASIVTSSQDDFLGGEIAIVYANETFCSNDFAEVAKEATSIGASGLIIINNMEVTLTLWGGRGKGEDKPTVNPTFNVKQSDGQYLLRCAGSEAKLSIPKLIDGKGPIPPVTHADDSLHATQIRFEPRFGEHVMVEAGQALFNPAEHESTVSVKLVHVSAVPVCDSEKSCHACSMLDHPLNVPAASSGSVFMIWLKSSLCIRPVSNYVRFAEQNGAIAVIFVVESPSLVTLGPGSEYATKIPAFTVQNSAVDHIVKGSWSGRMRVTLPAITSGEAKPSPVLEGAIYAATNSPNSDSDDLYEDDRISPSTNPNGRLGAGGVSPGVVVIIVFFSTTICAVFMYYTGKAVVIRHRRRRLHAFGHMTHSLSVQTDGDAFSNIGAGSDGESNRIVFNADEGALMFEPLEIDGGNQDRASSQRKMSVFEERSV